MDYEKIRLTPQTEADDKTPVTAAQAEAREQLKRHRAQTQQYKKQYFEFYDDVKIDHREDW